MKTVWETYDDTRRKEMSVFSDEYRSFLNRTKTEREFVSEAVKLAEAEGFTNISESVGELNPGDRLYAINRNKNLCLFVIGEKPIRDGLNILGAHIDSPRLDLKQHPLFEKDGYALMDTHYYGGIKKYQWVTRPMALHGVVVKKDGTTVPICIGEDPDDPVVGVSDILIHLAAKQMEKKASEAVEGEKLDLIVGSIPVEDKDEKEPVKKYLLDLLKEKYDIEEDDFISAEIEVVPADPVRDFGIDRSMIMGYGHDDRICAYTSLRAIIDMKIPKCTSCCILTDKEEIGSDGATGMKSRWFESILVNLLDRTNEGTLNGLNTTLAKSKMLSSDVSAGVDPNYDAVFEKKNAAFLGRGICFNKYTGARGKGGCNDANPEFIAEVRRVMDEAGVVFQTGEIGAVDAGGGGTIAAILAELNMDVLDAGVPVLNMHAPSELASKADLYEAYRAYKAFLEKIS
ncbi:MAG: aminopeptidase [Solobacterium sp.]|nr:aminopeptidase [Solobacterium sp.]